MVNSTDLLAKLYNAFNPFEPLPAGDPKYVGGMAFYYLGIYEQAIASYDKAIEIQPECCAEFTTIRLAVSQSKT
jgi:tetratricopeptide (TPR) repeat protein